MKRFLAGVFTLAFLLCGCAADPVQGTTVKTPVSTTTEVIAVVTTTAVPETTAVSAVPTTTAAPTVPPTTEAPAVQDPTTVPVVPPVTEESSPQEPQLQTYILNISSKKFHYPHCGSVKQMKEENKEVSESSREEIIARGYVPCKKCNP
jgi:hypothetical protein